MRRRTHELIVQNLQRAHAEERRQLLQVIGEQNDRLMYMAGRAWNTPTAEPEPDDEDEPDEIDDPDQIPYDEYAL